MKSVIRADEIRTKRGVICAAHLAKRDGYVAVTLRRDERRRFDVLRTKSPPSGQTEPVIQPAF